MTMLSYGEILARLGVAAIMGGVLGINRELRHKPAGLRTNALVALGAASVMVMAREAPLEGAAFDANAMTRVIQGILAGIGFLGGGVILRAERERRIEGLTTAATIWMVACLGVACGLGLWRVAGTALGLSLVVLVLGAELERWINRRLAPREQEASSDRVE
jgi:putative Mg2+ transporter-C (MgtC) family protein